MVFGINTTSDYDCDNRPCERAYKNEHGKWMVDIATLEELIAIGEEVRRELILNVLSGWNEFTIEIYDDWRE